MELRLAFTEFLFAFCAVVLADRVHGFSAGLSERLRNALGLGDAAKSSMRPAWQARADSDWYVHFHRSALTGEERAWRPKAPSARATPSAAPRTRRDTRPRLRA